MSKRVRFFKEHVRFLIGQVIFFNEKQHPYLQHQVLLKNNMDRPKELYIPFKKRQFPFENSVCSFENRNYLLKTIPALLRKKLLTTVSRLFLRGILTNHYINSHLL